MADRYWVGGSGTWNTTNTTNWSATSGGAGGASVPGATDNVFFNQAGTYTVTLSGTLNCLNWNVSAGSVTFAGSSPTLYIAGNLTFSNVTPSITWSSGTVLFVGGGTSTYNIQLNGSSLAGTVRISAGVGATYQLAGSLTVSGSIFVDSGGFNTSASGYSITASSLSATQTVATNISLNSSTVLLAASAGLTLTGSGLTFNAGTSTINLSGTSTVTLSSKGLTFYNVAFTGTPTSAVARTITGVNTFRSLTFTPPTSTTIGPVPVTLNAGQVVTTTFTGSGAAENRRLYYRSNAYGGARTLNLPAGTIISHADFSDITATNTINATTGGGNAGGNSNITFPTAKTVYWNLAGAQNWSATGWASTSGGVPNAANFPLPQDTAIFNDSGAATGVITISGPWTIGTINALSRTSALTLSFNSSVDITNSIYFSSAVSSSGNGTLWFKGRSTGQTLYFVNSIPNSIYIQNPNGTSSLGTTLTTTSDFILYSGTLALNGNVLTAKTFSSTSSIPSGAAREITFSVGRIKVTGGGATFPVTLTSPLSYTGSGLFEVAYSGSVACTVYAEGFTGGAGLEPFNFNFTDGYYTLTFLNTTARTANNVDFTGFSGIWGGTRTGSGSLYGNITLSTGMSLSTDFTYGILLKSTSGIKTITSNGKVFPFLLDFNGVGGTWRLEDALSSSSTISHTNGTIDLNGKTLTLQGHYNTNPGTKNLTFNGGTLYLSSGSNFNNSWPTGFTTTAGTGTGYIVLNAGFGVKTFTGGGSTFNCTIDLQGAGTSSEFIFFGNNTFDNIINTVVPTALTFNGGTTTTFNNFNVNGTSGNVVQIRSYNSTAYTFSKASGTVNVNYCSIQYSNATGGASWSALTTNGNVDNSFNSGWIFALASGADRFFAFF